MVDLDEEEQEFRKEVSGKIKFRTRSKMRSLLLYDLQKRHTEVKTQVTPYVALSKKNLSQSL